MHLDRLRRLVINFYIQFLLLDESLLNDRVYLDLQKFKLKI